MNIKKVWAILGFVMILGTGLLMAQQGKSTAKNGFMDRNGDGINDRLRDHDGDGIPNCQDPDWVKPEDGTGYQDQYGKDGERGRHGNMSANAGKRIHNWNRNSFRTRQGFMGKRVGTGICSRTRCATRLRTR